MELVPLMLFAYALPVDADSCASRCVASACHGCLPCVHQSLCADNVTERVLRPQLVLV
jgi:hypothetical protein